jgi:hypothetical protein
LIDADAIRPWTAAEADGRLVLRRPIAPPDLIVGALYGGLAAVMGVLGLVFAARAWQFRADPVGPYVLTFLGLGSFLLAGWAMRALRSDAVRELDVSAGRLGLGQGGLLGLRRSILTGTQIGGLRVLHRRYDEARGGVQQDRRWTELYLELPSMPDRFLGFFAGGDEARRERAAAMVADRLGVTPVIVHE